LNHHATEDFWTLYSQMPREVRELADKQFKLMKADPSHPSIRLKRVGRYWSARIGRAHRALAVESNGDLIWLWIGTHASYDRLIRQ